MSKTCKTCSFAQFPPLASLEDINRSKPGHCYFNPPLTTPIPGQNGQVNFMSYRPGIQEDTLRCGYYMDVSNDNS